MRTYKFSAKQIQEMYNQAREMIIDRIFSDCKVDGISKEELKSHYAFVILEKNSMGVYLDKLMFGNDSSPRVQLITVEKNHAPDPSKPKTPFLRLIDNEKEKN